MQQIELQEHSGSAFPATLAFQIRELERETEGDLKLDAIVTVIDAENFRGYEDKSPTAKLQASYTDLILIVRLLLTHSEVHRTYKNLNIEQIRMRVRARARHSHR